MAKIFPHRRRKPQQPRPFLPTVLPEDPIAHRLRVSAERRERERIEAGRYERMLQRRMARLQLIPATALGDAEWFAAHPDRSHYVDDVARANGPTVSTGTG